nr:thyroid adenoma-associated protein homolog [Paramormyrops kingsleyae]
MSMNESLQRQLDECSLVFLNAGGDIHVNIKTAFPIFIKNLGDCLRSNVKRCKERNLEEASQLLRRISKNLLESLEIKYMLPLIQLIISMQLETLQVSTVFRKLDQMMQHFSEINLSLVFEEVQKCLNSVMDSDQMLEAMGLQTVCMFLEDSTMGREVLRQAFPSLLHKVDQAFSSIMEQEVLRNGDACYNAVKVCLQMFQLLPEEVTPLVWKDGGAVSPLPDILKYLMDIILGESSSRDTRFLAGTAMVMLSNTSPTAEGGTTAAWNMLEVTCQEPRELRVGELRVQCRPRQDCMGRLAVSRGLLSCCRKDVLLCGGGGKERCLLLEGLFPIVSALCEKSFDCHYYVFQVLVLWLRQVKECLMELWDLKSAPLLPEDSILCRQLVQVVWNIAESPVEGVSESVHCSFRLLLEILDLERRRFPEMEISLYSSLLSYVAALSWEAKAKYFPLCALLPYVGSGVVFERFPDLPRDLLKCLSTNHLSPCASETYKSLIQQQRREFCAAVAPGPSPSELELAEMWAQRWRPALLEALTSDMMLLQSNASSHLLPWTLRTFPGAFEILQASLSGASTGHLRAWACLVGTWRVMGGSWSLEEGLSQETVQLALGSLDESVRLAALGLLCGGPRIRHPPSPLELATLKQFIPLNLNSESSPFRQQLQAMVKKLLVRIRDGCLACLRKERKGCGRDNGQENEMDSLLEQGVDLVDWLARLAFTSVAPGLSYQRKKTALLFLSAVLETCTDTWSPDKKKGQPPANMSALITWARCRRLWDFFSMSNLLVLITCLEDSTNEPQGAVEGCCCGLTRFCATLLTSCDTELQVIPGLLLEQVLTVLQGRCATSVTRRAAGLPMLVLCILSAEEAGKARPMLAHTMRVLLETAGRPVSDNWNQTLDLPQVGAVHTLQALVRGSGLGVAMLQFASPVAILSLTLLSSPCWAMRNAALQLYNALCSRMLGQRPGSDDGLVHHGMSPSAFFTHYPALQPFLLGELRGAASELLGASGEARLRLHPSLFPVLTLLAKLQPGAQDRTQSLSDFQMPLLQLAGSPIYHVRVVACRALVAVTPPVEHMNIILGLARQLPDPEDPCCHNRLHGQLLQMSALLGRALAAVSENMKVLQQVVELFESKWWLVTSTQRCPLIRLTYLQVLLHLRRFCSPRFLEQLQAELLLQLLNPTQEQLVGSASFLQNAACFLCEETVRLGDMRWVAELWENFPEEGTDVQLALIRWILEDQRWRGTSMYQVLETALQANLKAALLSGNVEYRKTYLAALLVTLTPTDPLTPHRLASPEGAELLLEVLESGAGGPELLSQALAALSLFLDISSESLLTDRWCHQLEKYRVPEAPEVLRLACAQAMRLAGPRLLCSCMGGGSSSSVLSVRLISTGLHLLNDEDQRVRAEAACFASAVGRLRAARPGESCVQVQASRGLLLLLDLLLEELWDGPETLEALLLHLPELDLGATLSDMRSSGRCSLYEQDEANVFAEPVAMSELLLPYLLRLADRYPECSSLHVSMALWVRENTGLVWENVSLCKQFNPADWGSWLRLLAEPRFHGALCGLFVRAGFLLRLLDTCEDLRPLCDPCGLRADFRIAHGLLRRGGVLLPAGIPLALGLE